MRYVRLTEVMQLQLLSLIKLSLDREDIRYRVLFEHSLHVGSYLLGGSRGAIIEVVEADYTQAVEILAEQGMKADGLADTNAFGKLHEVDLLTESLPLIGRWDGSLRLLFLALLVAVCVAFTIYFFAFG
ncbi:MAG: hypothetical protein WA952_06950 [Lewinella sp.]